MIRSVRGYTLIELLIFIVIIGLLGFFAFPKALDFFSSKFSSPNVHDTVKATYTPQLVPVAFQIATDGTFNVIVNGRVTRPIGTFSAEWERKKIYYLEVTLGTNTRFYKLGKNKFNIDMPNSLKGNSRITYDGNGNVRVIVPDPGNVRFPS
jgi:hypothetical protein